MRWYKWLGLVILVVVILLVTWAYAAKHRFEAQYQAQIAAIKASGAPVTPADLAGPPIPDDQNGAVLYEEAFKLMEPSRKRAAELFRLRKSISPASPLEDLGSEWARRFDPKIWQRAQDDFSASQKLISLAEEAASRPQCRFRADGSTGSSGASIPQFVNMWTLSRICGGSAILSARNGKMDESMHLSELSFRIGESLKDEPSLRAFSSRTHIEDAASYSLRESLKYGDITEAQAKSMFELLASADFGQGYRKAAEGERALFLINTVPMQTRAGFPGDGLAGTPDGPPSSLASAMKRRVLGFAYHELATEGDKAAFLRYADERIKAAPMPYREALLKGMLSDPELPSYAVVASRESQSQPYSRYLQARFGAEARVSLDRMLLALLAYKDRYGTYPADLAELRAKLGWNLPKDPYSGEDLKYEPQAKGFLLYSVGPDLKDDGGVQPTKLPLAPSDNGDVVLRCEK